MTSTFHSTRNCLGLLAWAANKAPFSPMDKFIKYRRDWVANASSEDVFNAMVDRLTKDGSTYGSNACFRPHEVQTIHDIFETYCQEAGTEKFWTKDTVLKYLLTQVPESSKEGLKPCFDTIYRCIAYFASYPFPQAEIPRDPLNCDDLTRTLAFVAGRDHDIFTTNGVQGSWDGDIFIEHESGIGRPTELSREMIFRSLAPTILQRRSEMKILECPDFDLVDILVEIQPKYSDSLGNYARPQLFEMASRLSPGRPPLQSIEVCKRELLVLLDFLVRMMDEIQTSDSWGREEAFDLARELEFLRIELFKTTDGLLSFDEINNVNPEAFDHIQLALAVLFNTFLQTGGMGHVNNNEDAAYGTGRDRLFYFRSLRPT
ncbi:hypothetical protein B0J14DRAFT_693970 [Halenospora varia]|nr:hypothetical protein B0J14DRAFT_693970 [Halenospora varia]